MIESTVTQHLLDLTDSTVSTAYCFAKINLSLFNRFLICNLLGAIQFNVIPCHYY